MKHDKLIDVEMDPTWNGIVSHLHEHLPPSHKNQEPLFGYCPISSHGQTPSYLCNILNDSSDAFENKDNRHKENKDSRERENRDRQDKEDNDDSHDKEDNDNNQDNKGNNNNQDNEDNDDTPVMTQFPRHRNPRHFRQKSHRSHTLPVWFIVDMAEQANLRVFREERPGDLQDRALDKYKQWNYSAGVGVAFGSPLRNMRKLRDRIKILRQRRRRKLRETEKALDPPSA